MTEPQRSSKNKIPVYFMPGMGANSKIFERLNFQNQGYDFYYLEWKQPLRKESLVAYCSRLLMDIKHQNPILIGVSFGGIVVQELAKLIQVRQVVIISSVKSPNELPPAMRWIGKLRLHPLLPTRLLPWFEKRIEKKVKNTKKEHQWNLYGIYMTVRNPSYVHWALSAMMLWKNENPIQNIVHLHGDQDEILPIKYIKQPIVVPQGTHALILIKAFWLNKNLPNLLKKEHE